MSSAWNTHFVSSLRFPHDLRERPCGRVLFLQDIVRQKVALPVLRWSAHSAGLRPEQVEPVEVEPVEVELVAAGSATRWGGYSTPTRLRAR